MTLQPIQAHDADSLCGERVTMVMFRRRLRQSDLAGVLGITQSALSRKLRGDRAWSLQELKVTAGALSVPTAFLLGETDDPGEGWAPWDSNPQPAGYRVRASVTDLSVYRGRHLLVAA